MKVAFFVEGQKSLGHMSRAMELEQRLLGLDPSVESVFFVNSTFLDPFKGKKVVQINIPDQGNRAGELGGDFSGVVEMVREERPDVLVFDTLYPRAVVDAFPEIPKVLVLRKYRDKEMQLFIDERRFELFDKVLIPHAPSEMPLAGEIPNAEFVEPIVKPVPESREKEGILVMCGGGGFADAGTLIDLVKGLDATVITGPFYRGNAKGTISYDAEVSTRLGKAEAVISAAGYNAVNEIIAAKVPSLLVPGARNNDDQEVRARMLVDAGGAMVYDPEKPIKEQVKELLKPNNQRSMRKALRGLRRGKIFGDASSVIHHLGTYRDYLLKVGQACNNNCVFCPQLDMKGEEKGLDALLDEVQKAKDAGYNRIVLPCNAEILKDFKRLLTGIQEYGMRTVLWTNGRMATYRNHAETVAGIVHEVKVNVSGEKGFSQVMRTESYGQMKKGITNLAEAGAKVTGVQTVIGTDFSLVDDLGIPVVVNYPIGSDVQVSETVEKVADLPSAGILNNPHTAGLDLNEENAEVKYVYDPDLIEVVELCSLRDCNINCQFCKLTHLPKERMSTGKIKETIDKISKYPVESLVFGGGEPTLRDDLEELVGYARAKVSSRIIISTNGVLLNQKKIERLVEAGTDMFVFAVHGIKETHDSIVKTPGAWKKLKKNLDSAQGVKKALKTVVLPENADEILGLVDFCSEHGLNPFILNLPHTEGPGMPVTFLNNFYYSILPDVYENAEKLGIQVLMRPMFTKLVGLPQGDIAKQLRRKGFDEEIELFSKELYGKRFYDEYPCKRKGHEFFITATGDVYRCIVSPIFDPEVGNVFKDGLEGAGMIPDDSCGKCKNYFEHNAMEEDIEVSIIVPTYERKGLLENTLRSLFRQDYPSRRYEIIVVDDGSLDGTEEMVRSLVSPCKITYVYWPREKPYVYGKPGNRAGPARNIGVRLARGDKILFWDSDMVAAPDVLSKHLQEYEGGVCSLGVRKYLKEGVRGEYPFGESDLGPDIRVSKMLKDRDYDVMKYTAPYFFWTSNNVMVSRAKLNKVGGFDPNFVYWGTEDQEVGYRLLKSGMDIKVVKGSLGYHQWHPDESVDDTMFRKVSEVHKEIFYKKFLDKDIYHYFKHFFQESFSMVSINLTSECNLSCKMCFDDPKTKKHCTLPIKILKETLKSISEMGIPSVNFSGGEPTLHPRLGEIITHAKSLGLTVSINTNGQFGKEVFEELVKNPPDRLTFSLDSHDPATFEKLRGKGAYSSLLTNLKNWVSSGNNAVIQAVLMKSNTDDMIPLSKFAEKVGASEFYIQAYSPYIGLLGGKSVKVVQKSHLKGSGLWPDKATSKTAIDDIISYKQSGGMITNPYSYLKKMKEYYSNPSGFRHQCRASSRIGINSDGRVMPCWGIDWKMGTILESTFEEIVSSERMEESKQVMEQCTAPCMLLCYPHDE